MPAPLQQLSRLLPFALFLAAWQALATSGLIAANFLPSVGAVTRALIDLGASASFYADLAVTLWRSLGGLALGALIGIPIGAGMAVSRGIDGFFGPLVKATYSLPKTALIPLLLLWLGVGSATNMVAVMLSTLLPFVVYTYHGISGVPQILVWSARAHACFECARLVKLQFRALRGEALRYCRLRFRRGPRWSRRSHFWNRIDRGRAAVIVQRSIGLKRLLFLRNLLFGGFSAFGGIP